MSATFQRLYTRFAPALARRGRAAEAPTAETIGGFRRAQRLAYDCVATVAGRLRPGITERAAARLLAEDLYARGVRTYLHRPFAWFGEHSRFTGYDGDFHAFHPGEKKLEEEMPYILDVSPIVDGFMADIGYTVTPRESDEQLAARKLLIELRGEIPGWFASSRTLSEIWDEVDQRVRAAGFESCHALYPLRVLGHRVYRVSPGWARVRLPRLPVKLMGFDWFSPQGLGKFAGGLLAPDLLTPENRQPARSRVGFWAIEPHVGGDGFGAKFEEILAVEPGGRAVWIDDDTPHVREAVRRGWMARGAAA
jgi:hypothetical protein